MIRVLQKLDSQISPLILTNHSPPSFADIFTLQGLLSKVNFSQTPLLIQM